MSTWLVTLQVLDLDGGARIVAVETKRVGGRNVVQIGRAYDCQVELPGVLISRRHCTLFIESDATIYVEDTSMYGTALNLERLRSPRHFGMRDDLYVGAFVISLVEPPKRVLVGRRARTSWSSFADQGSARPATA